MPPFELEAKRQEEVHERISDLRKDNLHSTPLPKGSVDTIKETCKRKMIREWKSSMKGTEQGDNAIIGAIGEQLQEWLDAKVGLSFRATQVITGHGCFSRYLCRIGRETTTRCWHCEATNDSSRHTLRYCPAWDQERAALIETIRPDLTPSTVIRALRRNDSRKTFLRFCETVMRKKEAAERAREGVIVPSDMQDS
ncbi:PREDICTED: uncharacterized protein LOC108762278 [Trachymyrmex cornetzi]|uniref:uncharacterized protein LOC108762278 n=1 Tax=Trachymyrmex cornetzi TaxID=471704 RepID=UPI00084F43FC|nr:PREDICTED: uncharacterized protein LOC108762278 [Trachymyrmex cornetzi]